MADRDRDIVERLVDFDHYGNTATERFSMRMAAAQEIKKLRADVERLRRSAIGLPVKAR